MSARRRQLLAALGAGALALAGCGGGNQPASQEGADVGTAPVPTTATTAPPADTQPQQAADQGPLGARLERKVSLRSSPGGKMLGTLETKTRWGSPRVLAVVEQRDGWLGVLSERIPGEVGWIPSDAVELLREPWSLRIDLSDREIAVSREGEVVRRIRVAVGAPGSPTPKGRFGVTDTLRLTGGGPYGCCAIALTARQRNIPQGWTGGDRVAIHGTNEPGSIGRAASHGCLRTREEDLKWLLERLPLGSHVEIVA
jgi:lipoprotein-anchoring transpeptidase ErfK/SrfK